MLTQLNSKSFLCISAYRHISNQFELFEQAASRREYTRHSEVVTAVSYPIQILPIDIWSMFLEPKLRTSF